MANLFDFIRRNGAAPDKTLLETADGGTITYGDMLAMSGRLANVLVLQGVTDLVLASCQR